MDTSLYLITMVISWVFVSMATKIVIEYTIPIYNIAQIQ